MDWFNEWFDDNYLELYADRSPEEAKIQADLIIRTLGKDLLNQKWLDVGCGTGRYTDIFNQLGCPITGIDLSQTMITVGKKNYPSLDIRHTRVENLLKEPDRFRVILSLFTSFGYYEKDDDNLDFLINLGKLGESQASLWLDFLNAEKILNEPLTDTVSQTQNGRIFQQKRRINHGRIEKEIEMYDRDGHYLKHYRESVRLYRQDDFQTLLPKAGFLVKKFFGDYQGGEYHSASPRLIIWAEKTN